MENYESSKLKNFVRIWVIVGISVTLLIAAGTVTFVVVFNSMMTGSSTRNVYNIDYNGNYSDAAEYIADMMSANVVEMFSQSNSSISTGTGFVITYAGENPIVMTNYHVIELNTTNIYARTVYESDSYVKSCTLLGYDEYHDIAIIKLPALYKEGSFLDLMDAAGEGFELDSYFATASTGEYLAAIGNALGEGLGMVDGLCTKGSTVIQYASSGTVAKNVPVLQTTAAINSGMSGSPIFNKYGQVVGVGTYKADKADDVNYGVPIDIALSVYNDVMAGNINSAKQVDLLTVTESNRKFGANISAVGSGSMIEYYQFNAFGYTGTNGFGVTLHNRLGISGVLLSGRGDGSKGLLDQDISTGLKVTSSSISGISKGSIITKINGIEITSDYGQLFANMYSLQAATTNAKEPIELELSNETKILWQNSNYRVVAK